MRYLGVDNNWPSRRVVLGTTLAAVGASGVKRSAAAGLASVGATRVFEWLDVYKRSDVQALTVAGDGKRVAVEITRALDEPGEHGGVGGPAVVPRGNIWLSDPELQGAR